MTKKIRDFFVYLRNNIIIYTAKTVFTFAARVVVGIILVFVVFGIIGAIAGSRSADNTTAIIFPEYRYTHVFGDGNSNEFIISIPINGVILGKKISDNPFVDLEGVAYGYEVKRLLHDLATDPEIRGVVLEIQSPGGTIFGSQAVVDGIRHFKELNPDKPVYAVIVGIGASGGYWIAAAADKVYADHGSLVGSIGVIAGPFTTYDNISEENGGLLMGGIVAEDIEHKILTAGEGKDIGNPYRSMTSKEEKVLQRGLDAYYDLFVAHVASGRNIEKQTIKNTIGAYPYDNITAHKLGLTDGSMSIEEVYDLVAQETNLASYHVLQVEKFINPFQGLFFSAQTIFTQKDTFQTVFTELCSQSAVGLVYYGDVQGVCK